MPTPKKTAGAKQAAPAGAAKKTRAPSAKGGGGSREYMKDFAKGRDNLFCESCGFNMRRDPDFGTAKNGKMTERYCAGCYQGGVFTEDVKTAEEFINAAVVRIAAQRKQAVGKTRLDLKRELPKLARWK